MDGLQGKHKTVALRFLSAFWSQSFCSSVYAKVGLQGYFVKLSGFARLHRETAVQVHSEQP